MRSVIFGIVGVLAVAGLGVLGWKKRDAIHKAFTTNSPKVRDAAKSACGRVANAFNNLVHTEKEQPPSSIGFKA